jgi:hypothetical protein
MLTFLDTSEMSILRRFSTSSSSRFITRASTSEDAQDAQDVLSWKMSILPGWLVSVAHAKAGGCDFMIYVPAPSSSQ